MGWKFAVSVTSGVVFRCQAAYDTCAGGTVCIGNVTYADLATEEQSAFVLRTIIADATVNRNMSGGDIN